MLTLDGVSVAFGSHRAVDDVDLALEDGHVLAVLGPSGSGKSSLLRAVAGLEPLRSGRVILRFEPRGGGDPVIVTQDAPRAPGIYGPAPAFTRPGAYDLTITVESQQSHDVIRVPDLRVYPSAEAAPKEEGSEAGGIPFLKEQQWKTSGFATAFATTGTVAESFQATGQIVPAAGRIGRVSAPVAGVVEPSGLARSPVPGERAQRCA